jgi:hypothetical protein
MNRPNPSPFVQDLTQHREICQKLLEVAERENHDLRQDKPAGSAFCDRKNLLPSLNQSLYRIRQDRLDWGRRSPRERAQETEVPKLLRELQDLIMKIIVLDRDNEQVLLRKGMIPARHLPPAARQRPHYVADLYRRQREAD